jgi:hypothetical protein
MVENGHLEIERDEGKHRPRNMPCMQEEGSHILRCEGTRDWRDIKLKKKVYMNTPGDWNKNNNC